MTFEIKTLSKKIGKHSALSQFPNFHKCHATLGLAEQYYGRKALLIKCGNYIYNVTDSPDLYDKAR